MVNPVSSPVRDMEYVEDSEWFDTKVFSTECYDGCHISSSEQVIFIDESSFIACEAFGVNEFSETRFLTKYSIDSNGSCNKEFSIDLRDCGLEYFSDDRIEYSVVYDYEYVNDVFYCLVDTQTLDDNGDIIKDAYVQTINMEDGTLGNKINNDSISYILEGTNYIKGSYVHEDRIYYLINSDGDNKLITINSDFELENEIELKGISFYNYACLLEDSLVINCINDKNQNEIFVYDIHSGEYDIVNDAPALLMKYNWQTSNLGMSYCDSTGIYSYDLESNAISLDVDFNQCNVNNNDFNPSATHVTEMDDRIFTWRIVLENGGLQYKIYEFIKSSSNPNVGKGIIKVADLEGLYDVAECIRLFNDTSENAYIVLDDRYVIADYVEGIDDFMTSNNYTSTDEYRVAYRNAKSIVSAKLRVDILAGDGPDIILNAFDLEEINRSQYLVDLNDTLVDTKKINSSEYIPAIFNTYDELYQMPLMVRGAGIMWDKRFMNDVDASASLTYDKYEELVSEVCNGHDPISLTNDRTDYLLAMFNNFFDDYVHDGKVDIDNAEFREMAKFVAMKPEMSEEVTTDDYSIFINPIAMCGGPDLGYISDYFTTSYPSYNGNGGIKLSCELSIAITQSCPLMDEAIDFVIGAMEYYGEYIKIETIRENSIEIIKAYNNDLDDYPESYGINAVKVDESLSDDYVAALSLVDGFVKSDSDISIILAEEIQPYFAGDKTIDEVIRIIEDRVQTVIDERG